MLRSCCAVLSVCCCSAGVVARPTRSSQTWWARSATATARTRIDRSTAAGATSPRPCTSRGAAPAQTEALAACRKAQSDYLGQDFNTRLDVQLWISDDESWYRCDVFLRNSTKSGAGFQSLTGSLKGVLDDGVSVDLQSCLDEPYDVVGDQRYVACSKEHVAQERLRRRRSAHSTRPSR